MGLAILGGVIDYLVEDGLLPDIARVVGYSKVAYTGKVDVMITSTFSHGNRVYHLQCDGNHRPMLRCSGKEHLVDAFYLLREPNIDIAFGDKLAYNLFNKLCPNCLHYQNDSGPDYNPDYDRDYDPGYDQTYDPDQDWRQAS